MLVVLVALLLLPMDSTLRLSCRWKLMLPPCRWKFARLSCRWKVCLMEVCARVLPWKPRPCLVDGHCASVLPMKACTSVLSMEAFCLSVLPVEADALAKTSCRWNLAPSLPVKFWITDSIRGGQFSGPVWIHFGSILEVQHCQNRVPTIGRSNIV